MILRAALIVALALSFVIPASALTNQFAHAAIIKIITNKPSQICKDPTGKHLLCILIISTASPPKHTLTCKDQNHHKFKCTFIVVNKSQKHVFNKVVIITLFVSKSHKHEFQSKFESIVVIKIIVKIVHEEDNDHHVKKIVVIREEDDNDKPTVVNVFCLFVNKCIDNSINISLKNNALVAPPVVVTQQQQITNIINNVQNINNVNNNNNNIITNTVLNANVNTIAPPSIVNPEGTTPLAYTPAISGPAGNATGPSSEAPAPVNQTVTTPKANMTQLGANMSTPNTTPTPPVNETVNTPPPQENLTQPAPAPPAPPSTNTDNGSSTPDNTTQTPPVEQPQTPPADNNTPPPVDCNANPTDPSCPQAAQPQQPTQACPDGSTIAATDTCPPVDNNPPPADNNPSPPTDNNQPSGNSTG